LRRRFLGFAGLFRALAETHVGFYARFGSLKSTFCRRVFI